MSHRRVAAVVLTSLLLAGCGDSTTEPGGETEVISRVTVTLTPPAGAAQTAFIDDADGNGPGAPAAQQGALALARNATYTGTIRFENRLENPPEDITTEVAAEANEHRVFYSVSGAGVTVTATDTDAQGRPLGLRYSVTTSATPAAGQLTVVLCHYDNVAKPATATSCTAETDINVSFSYTIQP
jgi:hypothetical protein